MKVLDTNLTGAPAVAQPPASAPAQPSGLTGPSSGSSANGDRVELSGFAGKLGAVLGAQTQDRATRVAALAREYQAGRYNADASQTSHALVEETLNAAAGNEGV